LELLIASGVGGAGRFQTDEITVAQKILILFLNFSKNGSSERQILHCCWVKIVRQEEHFSTVFRSPKRGSY